MCPAQDQPATAAAAAPAVAPPVQGDDSSAKLNAGVLAVVPALFFLYCLPALAIVYLMIGAPALALEFIKNALIFLKSVDLSWVPALGGIILLPICTYFSITGSTRARSRSIGVLLFYFFFALFLATGAIYLYLTLGHGLSSYDVPDLTGAGGVDASEVGARVMLTYVKEFLLYALTVIGADFAKGALTKQLQGEGH